MGFAVQSKARMIVAAADKEASVIQLFLCSQSNESLIQSLL